MSAPELGISAVRTDLASAQPRVVLTDCVTCTLPGVEFGVQPVACWSGAPVGAAWLPECQRNFVIKLFHARAPLWEEREGPRDLVPRFCRCPPFPEAAERLPLG